MLEDGENELPDLYQPTLHRLYSRMLELRTGIAAVTKEIDKLVKHYPVCSKLTALEGIGPIGALSLYAALGSGAAFTRSREFAAKLARPLTQVEIDQIHPSLHDRMSTAEIIVVCDARVEDSISNDYRCYEIVGQKIGGIHATLDYEDWEWCLGTLEEEDQPECQLAIKSRIGSKSLSLLEVHGHCDTFFYPNVDGGYDNCRFCAD